MVLWSVHVSSSLYWNLCIWPLTFSSSFCTCISNRILCMLLTDLPSSTWVTWIRDSCLLRLVSILGVSCGGGGAWSGSCTLSAYLSQAFKFQLSFCWLGHLEQQFFLLAKVVPRLPSKSHRSGMGTWCCAWDRSTLPTAISLYRCVIPSQFFSLMPYDRVVGPFLHWTLSTGTYDRCWCRRRYVESLTLRSLLMFLLLSMLSTNNLAYRNKK